MRRYSNHKSQRGLTVKLARLRISTFCSWAAISPAFCNNLRALSLIPLSLKGRVILNPV
ncbi:unknown protein [Microcystis aeruginosa NIES-843]|uniref:Uncharacterized protein n=1 Tax=Microcystis aeruginosa (strain NIES-843 / IAM M-2473) TaxID=449447 RepID=B0JWB0_MICAN|nr:unknown protein [Microcystis aeruginosa NIES-843]